MLPEKLTKKSKNKRLPCYNCQGNGYIRYTEEKVSPTGKTYISSKIGACPYCRWAGYVDNIQDNNKKAANDITESILENLDQEESHTRIKDHLNMIQNFQKNISNQSHYTPTSFILKFGKPYWTDTNSFSGKRGTPKNCYKNAFRLMTSNPEYYTYVEGYVDIGVLSIEHAWCINPSGIVVDPTLEAPEKAKTIVKPHGYFGVAFSSDYVFKLAIKTKGYGVLDFNNRELYDGKVPPEIFLAKNKIT